MEEGHGLFDLNCGCPVRKVARAGGGAALLQNEDLIPTFVRAMTAEAGPGRVGVKIRLGWERNTPVYLGLGPRLQEAGAAWITLHPRYGRQGFSGRAHWESLARLVQAVDIPVVASGDLFTAEDAVRCLQETGASAAMFARGALSDPAVFMRFKALWSSDAPAQIPSLGAIVNRMHDLCRAHGNPERMLLRMRTLVPRMIKGLPGAKNLRRDLTSCRSWENLHRLMESIEILTESTSD
jgi:tRNA-dihydrouridine synthase B